MSDRLKDDTAEIRGEAPFPAQMFCCSAPSNAQGRILRKQDVRSREKAGRAVPRRDMAGFRLPDDLLTLQGASWMVRRWFWKKSDESEEKLLEENSVSVSSFSLLNQPESAEELLRLWLLEEALRLCPLPPLLALLTSWDMKQEFCGEAGEAGGQTSPLSDRDMEIFRRTVWSSRETTCHFSSFFHRKPASSTTSRSRSWMNLTSDLPRGSPAALNWETTLECCVGDEEGARVKVGTKSSLAGDEPNPGENTNGAGLSGTEDNKHDFTGGKRNGLSDPDGRGRDIFVFREMKLKFPFTICD